MTTTNYPPKILIEVADLCALARGNIELYGWRQGHTLVGRESAGLCIGSALAMASDTPTLGGVWDWFSWAGDVDLCRGGEVLRDYATRLGFVRTDGIVQHWNDATRRSEEEVLALLCECEEAMRSDATDIIVGDIWDSLGHPVTAGA